MGESKKEDVLMKQDASSVDPMKLTALTPDVVRKRFSTIIVIVMRMRMRIFKDDK